MRIYQTALILFLGISIVPAVAGAYEINYANVEDIAGDTVLLKYRTTEGYTFATCSFDGDCSKRLFGRYMDNDAPLIFPSILNRTNYTKSPDGTRGVVELPMLNGLIYRSLYAIDGNNAALQTLIPYNDLAVRTSISYANDAVVFVGVGGVITRYDIPGRTTKSITTKFTSFPYWSLSEHGNFVATYSHSEQAQYIIDLNTGLTTVFVLAAPSYAVFSDSEERIAYLNKVDGFNKLFIANISDSVTARDVNPGNYTVAEYEFIGDTLYYIANTQSDPYEWNLYSYDPTANLLTIVDRDVAYDDGFANLKKTHTALLYEKVDGTHKDVIVLEGGNKTVLRADDVDDREASDEIRRRTVHLAGVPGVLLSPRSESRNTPLIVWLHGGPARQTSLGFHPFYGYAVYDEILERLAREAHVLKLDYTGSWGHGTERLENLKNHIGSRDVQDVLNAVRELKGDITVSDVHLFGPSYGGYLALRTLVEAPSEIDSVVSIAGVTDWTSLITRIPSSIFTTQFSGVPGLGNTDQYSTASIRDRVGMIRNHKVLLVYGENDATIPTWQSTEFFDLAKSQRKNVELVAYEGEGHTILKDDNLVDLCRRVARTFDLPVSLCKK